MEKTVEDPPTSAVLLDHCHFSQVIFNSVEKFYIPGGDVTCHYTFTQHFIPRRKDWIGIFRVGWKTTREYYTFMWVNLPIDLNNESAKQQEVQFKAYYLPKDDEYYQFCYVDQDGVVRGASIPFQFRPENEEDILVVTTQEEVEEIEQHNKELCKENQDLKDSCVSLQKQNSDMQAELQKKQEELETLRSINKKLELKVKEQEDYWETELLQLKEQNQKMSSENKEMGIRVDQLQAQLSTQEKEMEKLVQGDQDKTEQLEHLKKENDHLFLSLTEQRKDQKKLEQTVEEMKQNETTAMKKQQELMDENFELSRRLSEKKIICNVLQREKERLEGENDEQKWWSVPVLDTCFCRGRTADCSVTWVWILILCRIKYLLQMKEAQDKIQDLSMETHILVSKKVLPQAHSPSRNAPSAKQMIFVITPWSNSRCRPFV
ncbi:calcium-binding and coiled-coil domain-containing protein 2 isoform X3 [Aotus nancymaae]|uniref:calcium-binding and coiled-coil domain-containing protein 2 isoform X3 n=1 Tax=Aotus nancymaae TaxID=37293 RepID=UPI0006266727|nr:calcium-binding and coiled-coil domain-containing protein 2 isoform X3 [Aotus nancymaae]